MEKNIIRQKIHITYKIFKHKLIMSYQQQTRKLRKKHLFVLPKGSLQVFSKTSIITISILPNYLME